MFTTFIPLTSQEIMSLFLLEMNLLEMDQRKRFTDHYNMTK